MKMTAKINMVHQHTVLPKSSFQLYGALNSVAKVLTFSCHLQARHVRETLANI